VAETVRSAAPAAQTASHGEEDAEQGRHSHTYRRSQPKVGPNDPCPCGSGKKFKKCHGSPAMAAQARLMGGEGDMGGDA
jgi:preprotein translocase subunit SecA